MNTFLGRHVVMSSLDDHVFQRMFAYSRFFIFLQFVLRYEGHPKCSDNDPIKQNLFLSNVFN